MGYLNDTADSTLKLYWNCTGGTVVKIAQTLTLATWYYVVYVKTGTDLEIFVNGSSIGSGTVNATMTDSADPFFVGKFDSGTPNWYQDGIMDEMGVWSRDLTDAEITTLYNGGAGLQYPFTIVGGSTRDARALNLLGVG
jgi:hypothetical protein